MLGIHTDRLIGGIFGTDPENMDVVQAKFIPGKRAILRAADPSADADPFSAPRGRLSAQLQDGNCLGRFDRRIECPFPEAEGGDAFGSPVEGSTILHPCFWTWCGRV